MLFKMLHGMPAVVACNALRIYAMEAVINVKSHCWAFVLYTVVTRMP